MKLRTCAGVSYLQKLDYRMSEEHPPLAKVLAAIPLVIKGVRADYAPLSWSFSGKPFHQYLGEWVWGHALAISAQGSPGGPPPPDQWRNLAGFPLKGDIRRMFLNCIDDPSQMQPTFDSITAQFTAMMKEQKRKKKK
jgi:hypothetical protein